jgi:hypothetical protein
VTFEDLRRLLAAAGYDWDPGGNLVLHYKAVLRSMLHARRDNLQPNLAVRLFSGLRGDGPGCNNGEETHCQNSKIDRIVHAL